MTTVKVSLSKSYDVLIGGGLLGNAGQLLAKITPSRRAAVITDDIVCGLYSQTLASSLAASGFEVSVFTVPNGEGSKNAANFIAVLNWLAENRITRSDTVIALGGGVVGDLAGFAAASYLRGVRLVQIPTTLLAAVDSSVGGKTAIDLDAGKNLAGAFHQPSLVVCDYDTLDTLPVEVLRDGLSEVIKYGVIGDEKLFLHIEEKGTGFDREYVISECVRMKRDIVSEDEFDTGLRRLLNFGHTVGHAIEQRSCFSISHGKAVAIGMAVMARASKKAGYCSADCAEKIISAIKNTDLPTECPYPLYEIFDVLCSDKKISGDTITAVVPEKVGKCVLIDFSLADFNEFLRGGI